MSGKRANKGTRRHNKKQSSQAGEGLISEHETERSAHPSQYAFAKHKRGGRLWWWLMSIIVPIMDSDIQELTASILCIRAILDQDAHELCRRTEQLERLDPGRWTESDFGDAAIIGRYARLDKDPILAADIIARCRATRNKVMKATRAKAFAGIILWLTIGSALLALIFCGVVDGICRLKGLSTPPSFRSILLEGFALLARFITDRIVRPVAIVLLPLFGADSIGRERVSAPPVG
jgi:hypothetical protein